MKRWTLKGRLSPIDLDEIAALLKSGGVVLMPTDTIYGLHATIGSTGVARIVNIKGRDDQKPFVTIAASIPQIEALGTRVPRVLHDVWPAPLTAILQRGKGTIAVRVPDVVWLRLLLEQSGPLISTSANRSGESPITFIDQLGDDALEALDGLIDGGQLEGKPSAIVDFTGSEPRLVREGDPRFAQKLRKTLRKYL